MEMFRAALQALQRLGVISLQGAWARLAAHVVSLGEEDEALWGKVRPEFSGEARFRPPTVRELSHTHRLDMKRLHKCLKRVARRGDILEFNEGHFVAQAALAEFVSACAQTAMSIGGPGFTAAHARDRIGGGRKNVILLLEFLDRHGVTIRRGSVRRMNPRRLDLFAASS